MTRIVNQSGSSKHKFSKSRVVNLERQFLLKLQKTRNDWKSEINLLAQQKWMVLNLKAKKTVGHSWFFCWKHSLNNCTMNLKAFRHSSGFVVRKVFFSLKNHLIYSAILRFSEGDFFHKLGFLHICICFYKSDHSFIPLKHQLAKVQNIQLLLAYLLVSKFQK